MTPEERREYDRRHYQKHRERRRAEKLASFHAHREEYQPQRAAYRDANREAINLSQRIGLPVAMCRKMLERERYPEGNRQVQPPDGGAC